MWDTGSTSPICICKCEKALGADSPDLATDLHNLAVLLYLSRQAAQALPFYDRALRIRLKSLGVEDKDTQATITSYASALRVLHRDAEAQALETRLSAGKQKTGGNQ